MNTEKLEIIQKNLEELFFLLDGFEKWGEKVVYWNKQEKCWEYEQYSYYPSIRHEYVKLYIGDKRCTIIETRKLYETIKNLEFETKNRIQQTINELDIK